ncbi:uncharacterized protein LOC141680916 [Apium graveolens]|uniref:uncharacterized protein LOC141680916 n=1 Tax=Apium graveolens TaxID=4045 RepID=UPI003D7AF151
MATGGRLTYADMQNPLFLHPSDGPLSISVAKLTWNICIIILLQINTAHDIWLQLEKRFILSNGSRKYKLSKDLFGLKQNKLQINDYFTTLSSLWEELDSMNALPTVTTVAIDVTSLLTAIETQKAESKLFQFLNGLDECYSAVCSQLLMQIPLPSVEMAFAAVQQEETQTDVLHHSEFELSAMFSKTNTENRHTNCSACGGKGHNSERCWTVIGYPKWHPKARKPTFRGSSTPNRWSNHKADHHKMANNAHVNSQASDKSEVAFTPQQLQQLLKLLPSEGTSQVKGYETEDELENCFSRMVSCNMLNVDKDTWIIDSGASDHMTSSLDNLMNVQPAKTELIIKLPTGDTTKITHTGDVKLRNGLVLHKVLTDNAPEFSDINCKALYAAKGTLHQTSCVARPQQNARAERRHRSILEIARCLRFQAGLPLYLWGDCVMTAVYLLNRLPTHVLGNHSPYAVLFHKEPDYDALKIFGCLTFASNPEHTIDKFKPKGVPCVFLGYPVSQKGYKLLDLTTRHEFVSRDVTFAENVFP